ncbi:unnamed protein product [Arctogadus glacialis]
MSLLGCELKVALWGEVNMLTGWTRWPRRGDSQSDDVLLLVSEWLPHAVTTEQGGALCAAGRWRPLLIRP